MNKNFLRKNQWYEFSYSDGNGELSMFAQFKGYEKVGNTIFILIFHSTVGQHGLINISTINRIHAYNPNNDSNELNLILTES